jgi:hypothetical protein
MKKSILILIFFISLGAKAQGNLQFNQVINYKIPAQTVSTQMNTGTIQTTVTIPTNKVWKIEAASYNGYTIDWSLRIDNYFLIPQNFSAFNGYYTNFVIPVIHFPIWLPSGTYTVNAISGGATSSSINFQGASISIIEFNITQ